MSPAISQATLHLGPPIPTQQLLPMNICFIVQLLGFPRVFSFTSFLSSRIFIRPRLQAQCTITFHLISFPPPILVPLYSFYPLCTKIEALPIFGPRPSSLVLFFLPSPEWNVYLYCIVCDPPLSTRCTTNRCVLTLLWCAREFVWWHRLMAPKSPQIRSQR